MNGITRHGGRRALVALARRALEAVLVVLVCAGVAELGLRVFQWVHPTFLFSDLGYNRYRFAPGSPHFDIRMNSQGFLDTEFSPQRRPGVARVVALGDSFAVGVVPYRDNFLTRAEAEVEGRGVSLEIYNMGIVATGVDAYRDLLEREGLAYRPDMVLVCLFVGNDFTDRMENIPRRPALYLSRVYKLLQVVMFDVRHRSPFLDSYCDDCPDMQDEAFLRLEFSRSEIYDPASPSATADFAWVVAQLEAMRSSCDAHGARLAVMVIPDELQVDETLQRRIVTARRRSGEDSELDFRLPNQVLARELGRLGVTSVDVTEVFAEAAARGERLYKPNNTHWNVRGNALAADLLADFLVRERPAPGAR